MDKDIDWVNAAPVSLYWFCLRRNFHYRHAVDLFANDIKEYSESLARDSLVSHMSEREKNRHGLNDQVIMFSGGKLPIPIDSKMDSLMHLDSELEECRRVNEWYREILTIWKIYPQRYRSHYPEPVLTKRSTLKVRLDETTMTGEIRSGTDGDFVFRGNAIYTPVNTLREEFEKIVELTRAKYVGLLPKSLRSGEARKEVKTRRVGPRGPEIHKFEAVKRRLQIISEWERFHQLKLSEQIYNENQPTQPYPGKKNIWPESIDAFVPSQLLGKDKRPKKLKYLSGEFKQAIWYINNPGEVFRLIKE
jgi:hypothetical protein